MPDATGFTPQIAALKGLFRGRRCFVVGSGPSLASHDLSRLNGDFLFVLNRGYRAFEMGLPRGTCALVVSDFATFAAYADEVAGCDIALKFFRADVAASEPFQARRDDRLQSAFVFPFHRDRKMHQGHFCHDLPHGTHRGYTVALDAVQIAAYMGFDHMYLLGCDFDYSGESTHFYGTADYENRRRNDMPMDLVFKAFGVAAAQLQARGVSLSNAGNGGRLDVLPRVRYDELF